MRIATWNVERLKQNIQKIQAACEKVGADILVLTETDERICLSYKHCLSTSSLKGITEPTTYAETEKRVLIYTNYECIRNHSTYDDRTAICVELATEHGNLLVYGTIIGVKGNRDKAYLSELEKQMEDIKLLSLEHNLCVIGDYNCSFGDNYYFTTDGRRKVSDCFQENGINLLTAEQAECIDHIAISEKFLEGLRINGIDEWNTDKRLSDHKGIFVEIRRNTV